MSFGNLTFTATLWQWTSDKGPAAWYFFTVPPEQAVELRLAAQEIKRGFRSVKVQARIGDTRWSTSVFPDKEKGFLLPVKKEVRNKEGLATGSEATITLEF